MATCIQDTDEDVPPLEDMTKLLQRVKVLQRTEIVIPSPTPPSADKSSEITNSGRKKELCVSPKKNNLKEHTEPSQKNETFMGMKKGFLLGGLSYSKPNGKPKKNQKDNIPLIKPKQDDSFRIEEVQDEMKKAAPLLQGTDWLTNDLLNKLESHPNLKHMLDQPEFVNILSKFEKNPDMARAQLQYDPKLRGIFMDFCSLMGDHFTSLAGQSAESNQPLFQQPVHIHGSTEVRTREQPGADMSVRSSTDPSQPTAQDEARMNEIQSDLEIQEAFTDVRNRAPVTKTIRNDSQQAQETVCSTSPERKRKTSDDVH